MEPKIGHLKKENRLGRCFLKGLIGDAINVTLAAAGSNLRKLLAALSAALIWSLWQLTNHHIPHPKPPTTPT
ncbi:MAG: hypothetical protein R3C01_18140 [Planctomycetaceae bacterium]